MAVRAQSRGDTEPFGELVESPNRAKGKALAQVERPRVGGVEGIEVVFVFESELDGLKFGLGASGEVGNGAVKDFALLTEGLTEEDAVIGFAVDRGFGAVEIHSEHIVV